MEKGQLRCDANISIRPVGQVALGVKVELKNLNSFSFRPRRHLPRNQTPDCRLESSGVISQETRQYDGETGLSYSMRSKENGPRYRYFPIPTSCRQGG